MTQFVSGLEEIAIDGFQVVSGSMFAHFPKMTEASCTIWNNSISFNKTAITALNCCERIMIRVNAKTKCLLISPALSSDRDSIAWLSAKKKIQSKKMDCKGFTSQLYRTWGYEDDMVYRAYGKIVTAEKKVMLLFDFSNAENWKFRTKYQVKNNG